MPDKTIKAAKVSRLITKYSILETGLTSDQKVLLHSDMIKKDWM